MRKMKKKKKVGRAIRETEQKKCGGSKREK